MKTQRFSVSAIVLTLIVCAHLTTTGEALKLEGKWPLFDQPYAQAVTVENGLAFLATGLNDLNNTGPGSLIIMDVSDPLHPWLLSGINTGGHSFDVAVRGTLAYVASGRTGLQVVDVSNPADPMVAASISQSRNARAVTIAGSYAYVVCGHPFTADGLGLWIINVAQPTNPAVVGSLSMSGSGLSLAVNGRHAYVGNRAGVEVIDVSAPAQPMHVGGYPTGSSVNRIVIRGSIAYVADESYFSILDISNATRPTLIGRTTSNGWCGGMVLNGNYAYLAKGSHLQVIDVSNPAGPVTVRRVFDDANGLALVGDHLFSAYASGLVLYDVQNRAEPIREAFASSHYWAERIAIRGNYAHLVGNGLDVIDVGNPAHPVHVGRYQRGERRFALDRDYAYLALSFGVEIVDISSPSHPFLVGACPVGILTFDIAISGHHAYVSGGYITEPRGGGLHVIDVANPAQPIEVGRCMLTPNGDIARSIAVRGDYAYVACENSGIRVVDVSNPAAPRVVAGHSGYAERLVAGTDYVYVTGSPAGIRVFDISDPPNLFLAGSIPTSDGALVLHGSYLYTSSWINSSYGVVVWDLGNPAELTAVDSKYYGVGAIYDAAVNETHAYVASGGPVGLRILDVRSLPPKPLQLNNARLSNGQFKCTVSGEIGTRLEVLASTNLLNWELVLARTNTVGPISVSVPVRDSGAWSYRAVSHP